MRILLQFLLCAVLCPLLSSAQQTVGIFKNSQAAFNGYTLFSPMEGTSTYLINNCGELVHEWTSTYRPGMIPYLLDDGILLRPAVANNPTFALGGGSAGLIQALDWDGTVLWEYLISSETECQHHDVEPLPNGNILAVVWDVKDAQQAQQAGRRLVAQSVWSEKIVEIEPDFETGTGRIVWEWRAWDHLIQDHNPQADNHGDPANFPLRIDVNYAVKTAGNPDWLHINSIDYDPGLDQIIVSVHAFNEVWIIDHSTTTDEARGSEGGRSMHGGDLLYRWGNAAAYRHAKEADRRFTRQHDARWVRFGADSGKIMVFNNDAGQVEQQVYSAIEVFDPQVGTDGSYSMTDGRFGPVEPDWTFKTMDPSDMHSTFLSGADRLRNGNTLICVGDHGRFFEVDPSGEIVWEYVNPLAGDRRMTQGEHPQGNSVFRVARYSPDHPAFAGKDLIPQGFLEEGSDIDCQLFVVSVHDGSNHGLLDAEPGERSMVLFPLPASTSVTMRSHEPIASVCLIDELGRTVLQAQTNDVHNVLRVDYLPNGVYLVLATISTGATISSTVIVQH